MKQIFKKSISAGKKISDPADKTEISGIPRNFERYCEPWTRPACMYIYGRISASISDIRIITRYPKNISKWISSILPYHLHPYVLCTHLWIAAMLWSEKLTKSVLSNHILWSVWISAVVVHVHELQLCFCLKKFSNNIVPAFLFCLCTYILWNLWSTLFWHHMWSAIKAKKKQLME